MKKYFCILLTLFIAACSESFLDENPKNFQNAEGTYSSTRGFQSALNGLMSYIRLEHQAWNNSIFAFSAACPYETLQVGLDICQVAKGDPSLVPFEKYSYNNTNTYIANRWKWAFGLITNANMMINYAEKSNVNWTDVENDKPYFQANARFARAYAYRTLVYLFGDVPWIDAIADPYRTDYERTPKNEVLDNMIADLEFAAKYLPDNPSKVQDGQLTKWAALHLLSEICIYAKKYDRAISAANEVIGSTHYSLIKARFGVDKEKPGDPYSDMFKDGNHNYNAGNNESIWVIQDGYNVTGGAGANNDWTRRAWVPAYYELPGFIISVDYGGRGLGQIRPSNYFLSLFEDKDMRNSEYNIRRNYYCNDPKSELFGKLHILTEENINKGHGFPAITKYDYGIENDLTYSGNNKDKTRMRLAETYLLLAEAYLMDGEIPKATKAINVVRDRAGATSAEETEMNIDYLLDERARELIGEELRRFTLVRTGKLLERTRKYNPVSKDFIEDKHAIWPIPQNVLDANSGKPWKNNWD